MKLREVINKTGKVSDLAFQFLDAMKSQNRKEADRIKSMIATSIMSRGWEDRSTEKFLNDLEAVATESDVVKLVARHDADDIYEAAPADQVNTYKAVISIDTVEKNNVKSEVKNLEDFLKGKGIKIVKAKAKPLAVFAVGDSDLNIMDINVDIIFRTNYDRDDLYSVIEPAFRISTIKEK